jgi:hypothetical protein
MIHKPEVAHANMDLDICSTKVTYAIPLPEIDAEANESRIHSLPE